MEVGAVVEADGVENGVENGGTKDVEMKDALPIEEEERIYEDDEKDEDQEKPPTPRLLLSESRLLDAKKVFLLRPIRIFSTGSLGESITSFPCLALSNKHLILCVIESGGPGSDASALFASLGCRVSSRKPN